MPYKIPSAKIQATPILLARGIFNFSTVGIGIKRINTSMLTFMIPKAKKATFMSPQVLLHIFLQMSHPTRIVDKDHEMESAAATQARILYRVRNKMRTSVWQRLHLTRASPNAKEICMGNESCRKLGLGPKKLLESGALHP